MISNNFQAQAFKGTIKFENKTAETQTNWDGELQKIFIKAKQNRTIQYNDQQEIKAALKLAAVPSSIYSNLDLFGKRVTTSEDNGQFTAKVGDPRKPYLTFSCDA